MVKAELQKNPEKRVVAIAFEASRDEDLEVLDAIHDVIVGDFEKRVGYINSRRFVVQVKVSQEEADSWKEEKDNG
jgi:hypothetical protein